MKRVIAIALVVNAVLLAGNLLKKEVVVHAAAGGGGAVPVGNGDVNGDGEYDITDAVYYLSWRFLAGPAPVPIECPPPAGKGLPATGQTKCYDAARNEISCNNPDFPGQDGFYQAGCPNEGRFVDNGDGTVTDNCTGLMWQKDTADVNGDGVGDINDRLSWHDALAYCENLSLGGGLVAWNDWRLPNLRELQSIVDYGRLNPSADPVFGTLSGYWSSTSYAAFEDEVWLVNFGNGSLDDSGGKNSIYYVRAVRNAP